MRLRDKVVSANWQRDHRSRSMNTVTQIYVAWELHKPGRSADELALAQQYADEFLDYYHHRSPHLSLDMMSPAQFAESHLP